MKKYIYGFVVLVALSLGTTGFNWSVNGGGDTIDPPGKRYKPIELRTDYNHNKFGTSPIDLKYEFAAYTTSFDSDDDDNGDGVKDVWGVPEWVAFEIKRFEGTLPKYKRPSPWLTDDELHAKGLAPNDDTYKVSGTRELPVVKTNSRFVRGHMCPKNAADRLGQNAGHNTHTILNAVPQLQWQNNGIWKSLEQDCTEWADRYGSIWVVCGPAYFKKNPSMWLGQQGNVPAAIPDAIWKIVIRENRNSETGVETMAFMFPNIIPSNETDVAEYLTSIQDIQNVTGLEFLTTLSAEDRATEIAKHYDMTEAEKHAEFEEW